ncbi:MAG TPA: kelch repeat-containing protein [Gemmataceae bacterium]|nr:kelch repeat-containing protein [Gemmataceae bacterium]
MFLLRCRNADDRHCTSYRYHARVVPRLEALEDRTLMSWSELTGLPNPETYLAAALVADGRIFALGGTDSTGEPTTTVQAYTINTNSWSLTLAPLPVASTGLAAPVGPDGRIYAMAGQGSSGINNTLAAYTVASNTWLPLANIPTPRYDLAAVTGPDGRLYAIGGVTASGTSNVLEAYNTRTNIWVPELGMLTPRSSFAAVLGPDGRIYAIGGLDANGQPLASVEAYTVASNRWNFVANMPTPLAAPAAAVGPDGLIYAIGGADVNGNPLDTVLAYTIATDSWSVVLPMPTARSQLAAVTGLDGRIYAVGGRNATGPLATLEAMTVAAASADPRNPAFVAQVYLDLLHRSADAAGAAAFLNLLNQGLLTRPQMVLSVEASVEYRTEQINAIYEKLLHRPVDSASLNAWLGFLAGGGTYEQIDEFVAASAEFFIASGGSNDSFLNALYQDALGRAPDPAGRSGMEQILAGGGSRTQVTTIVFTSLEYDLDLVNIWYETFLHRPADATGLNNFASALGQGTRDETIVADIVGSVEYLARL